MILAALTLCALAWCGCVWADRLLPDARPATRWTAAATLALGAVTVIFHALDALHRVGRAGMLAAVVALTAATWWALGRDTGRRSRVEGDLAAAFGALTALRRDPVAAAALAATAFVAGWRVLRGLVSPTLAWDALTYHLARPARAIQYGYDRVEALPDQWGYLEFFPRGGDIPWAWALALDGTDALLAPTGALVWSLSLLAAWTLARELGASRDAAWRAALAAAMIPAAVNVSTSGYADDFVYVTTLSSLVWMLRAGRGGAVVDAALASLAASLCAGAKLSGLPGLVIALAAVGWWTLRTPHRARAAIAAACVAMVVLAPPYLRTWMATRSLTWPVAVTVAGHTLSRGNAELMDLYAGRLFPPTAGEDDPGRLLEALTEPRFRYPYERLDWGPALVWALPLTWFGTRTIVRARRDRLWLAAAFATTALPLAAMMSDAFVTLRTVWQLVVGRLLLALPALCFVVASRVEGALPRALWLVVLAVEVQASIPLGTSRPTWEAIGALAPFAALSLAVGAAAFALGRRASRVAAVAGALVAAAVTLSVPASRVRARHRDAIWPMMLAPLDEGAFELHPLAREYATAYPLWQRFDDGAPHRLAVTLGWDGLGHNGYRLPLLGTHFQNTVLYVPPSRTGEVIDLRDEARFAAALDPVAWMRRLREQRIDHVIALHPPPAEQDIMDARPEVFEPVGEGADGQHRAYRFHPERVP